jgi:hypothetical protein
MFSSEKLRPIYETETVRVHIMYLHRFGEPPASRRLGRVLGGGFGVTEATVILFAGKHRKNVKNVFPSTLERRNCGIEFLSVNATSTNYIYIYIYMIYFY